MLAARRMMHVVAFRDLVDTFNRANSTTGFGTTSDGNATWTARDGVGGITSNQAVCVSPGGRGVALATVPGTSDGYARATAVNSPSGIGPVFRYSDNNNLWVVSVNASISGASGLYRFVGGVQSKVLSVPVSNGDVVEADYNGTLIQVFVNGTSVGSVTDSANVTASNSGVWIGPGDVLDDFHCSIP